MFIRLGVAKQSIIDVSTPMRKTASRFPAFVENNESVMRRVASLSPIMLNPEKFLYMRTRMVSAVEMHGPNANGDAFEHIELAQRYPTFINAAINVDHDNDDPEKAVGIILDARYIPEQMYVEGIHAIDRERAEAKHPGIIKKLEERVIKDTSMGCFVEASICSSCLKEAGWDGVFDLKNPEAVNRYVQALERGHGIATVPEEYCRHVGKFGEKKGGMNGPYEFNRGVTFFEDSIITTQGADKDAKYIERIAEMKMSHPDWMKYVSNKVIVNGAIVSANLLSLKGDGAMEDLKKIAKEEGSEMSEKGNTTVEDKGNYSEGADKDKDLFQESKKPAPASEGMKGDPINSADEKANYALASVKAISTVKELMKHDPKGVMALLKEGDGMSTPENPVAEKVKEIMPENKKEDVVEKLPKKKPGLLARALALFENLAAMEGNQIDTMDDKGDYGNPHDKDMDEFNESTKPTEPDAGMKGSQVMTTDEKKNYPLSKRSAEKKEADMPAPAPAVEEKKEPMAPSPADEKKDKMMPAKEGEDPRASTMEGENEKKERLSALNIRRQKIADELAKNSGSMGSDGLPEKDSAIDDVKDFHKKVEGPINDAVEKAEETVAKKKEAGEQSGPTPVDSKVDEGNKETLDTEEIRKDNGRKVGKKTVAEEGDEIKADEAPESPNQKQMTAFVWTDKKDGKLAWGEKSSIDAKAIVEAIDEKEAGIRELMSIKTDRAEVFAQYDYKKEAHNHLQGINALEKRADKLADIANRIAGLIEAIDRPWDTKQAAAKQAAIDNVLALVAEADGEMTDTKKDLGKMKEDDMKSEGSFAMVQKLQAAENKATIAQKQAKEAQMRTASLLKSKVVADTIKLGMRKGVVTEANKQRYMQKLSTMLDVQFEATKLAWMDLEDAQVKKTANKETPTGLGELTPRRVEAGVSEDSLESDSFFED